MKAFYEKHPLVSALALIILYVIGGSVLLSLCEESPLGPVYPLLFHLALALLLLVFLHRAGLLSAFGLCAPRRPAREFLFYIPLALAPLVNFLYPFAALSPPSTVIAFFNMLLVGLVEELIFRGFLYRAMAKDFPRAAVILSSVTFGIGHIVNLINGAPPVATLCQIVYACIFGFVFVRLLLESKSLLPAILCHSAVNATSVFVDTGAMDDVYTVITAIALSLVGLFYLAYLHYRQKSARKGEKS